MRCDKISKFCCFSEWFSYSALLQITASNLCVKLEIFYFILFCLFLWFSFDIFCICNAAKLCGNFFCIFFLFASLNLHWGKSKRSANLNSEMQDYDLKVCFIFESVIIGCCLAVCVFFVCFQVCVCKKYQSIIWQVNAFKMIDCMTKMHWCCAKICIFGCHSCNTQDSE